MEKQTPFAGCMQVNQTERSVEVKASKALGVRTKYLRTICFAMPLENTELSCASSEHLSRHPFELSTEFEECLTEALPPVAHDGNSVSPNPALMQRNIYAVRGSTDTFALYAFLTEDEVEAFKRTGNNSLLVTWLSASRTYSGSSYSIRRALDVCGNISCLIQRLVFQFPSHAFSSRSCDSAPIAFFP